MKISLLGIGALKIQLEHFSIYIDAINSFNSMPTIFENDILLFTHDDDDHFFIEKFKNKNINNTVIAPPNVILDFYKSNIIYDKLNDFLPHEYGKPINHTIQNVEITIFQTQHFIDWHNTQISFLINVEV